MKRRQFRTRISVVLLTALLATSLFTQPVYATIGGQDTLVGTNTIVGDTPSVSDNTLPDDTEEVTETETAGRETEGTQLSDTETSVTGIDTKVEVYHEIEAVSTVSGNATVSDNTVDHPPLTYHEIDFEPDYPEQSELARTRGVLPSSYSSVDAGMISGIRNQNPYGTCWAHAAMASAETSMVNKGNGNASDLDYSERELAYFFYHYQNLNDPLGNTLGDYTLSLDPANEGFYNQGGNNYLTTWALANWIGAGDETDAPYGGIVSANSDSYMAAHPELAFQDLAHLQNAYYLSFTEPDSVKQMIVNNGALAMSYFHHDNYLSSDENSYFCNVDYTGNHAVTLVGWNDNYSKDNFGNLKPTSNGAWLIKNSWGTGFGDGGYFWISYEDATLENLVAFDFEPADNYEHNYFYDGSFGTGSMTLSSGKRVANVFTASGRELLKAVSIGLNTAGVSYSIQIYKNPTSTSDPATGTAMLTTPKTGRITYAGYHTMVLDTPVTLEEGDRFSVVYTLSSDSGSVDVNIDFSNDANNWIEFVTTEEAGQSFAEKSYGWYDCINFYSNIRATARIKAFSDDYTSSNWSLSDSTKDLTYSYDKDTNTYTTYQLGVTSSEGVTADNLTWTSSDTGVATVDAAGKVTAKGAGTATITAAYGRTNKTCVVTVKKPAEYLVITSIDARVYTGSAIEPDVVVWDGETELTEDEDYTLGFRNNTNVGGEATPEHEPTITVTGIGRYCETADFTFEIVAKDLEDSTITVDPIPEQVYTGIAKTPALVIKDGTTPLILNTDYTVTFSNNTQVGNAVDTPTEVPTASIQGIGNYTGSRTVTFTIRGRNMSEAAFTISAVPDQTYTGGEVKPVVTVHDTETNADLIPETDYQVSYSNNIKAGSAVTTPTAIPTVIVTGIGNYTGQKSVTFVINPKSLTAASITASAIADQEFSGRALKPVPTVSDAQATLRVGTDYRLSYENNVHAGNITDTPSAAPTVVITGMGNYQGRKEVPFVITPKSIENLTLSISPKSVTPTDSAQLAAGVELTGISLRDTANSLLTNNYYLVEGTDYTVSYSRNTTIGTATVTVNGKGDYDSDTQKSANFTINGISITRAKFNAIPAQTFVPGEGGTGAACKPQITVRSGINGYIPAENTDFTVTYTNNTRAGTAKAVIEGAGIYTGKTTLSFKIKTSNLSAMDMVIGDYNDTLSAVAEGLTAQTYSGAAVRPDVSVVCTGEDSNGDPVKVSLREGTDYTLSYGNNKNIGSARLIVRGRGNFNGTVTRDFEIVQKDFTNDIGGTIVVTTPDMKYTGRALKPTPTVIYQRDDGVSYKLRKNSEYTIAYEDNIGVTPGTAYGKVIVTGKGNFTGTAAEVPFKIAGIMASGFKVSVNYPTSQKKFAFDGKPVTLDYDEDGSTEGIIVKYRNTVLTETTPGGIGDYSVSYQNNDKAGYAQAIITGEGDYAGTKVVNFRITVKVMNAENSDFTIDDITDQTYTGYLIKPSVTVTDSSNIVRPGGVLIEGVDYRLAYGRNRNRSTAASKAYVKVIGKGAYSGNLVKEFVIE